MEINRHGVVSLAGKYLSSCKIYLLKFTMATFKTGVHLVIYLGRRILGTYKP